MYNPASSDGRRVQLNAAEQVELKLQTPWRDGIARPVMSQLAFMHRHIVWQLCGGQICRCYVASGSVAPVRHREKLTLAPQFVAVGATDCRASASRIRLRRTPRLVMSARPWLR